MTSVEVKKVKDGWYLTKTITEFIPDKETLDKRLYYYKVNNYDIKL